MPHQLSSVITLPNGSTLILLFSIRISHNQLAQVQRGPRKEYSFTAVNTLKMPNFASTVLRPLLFIMNTALFSNYLEIKENTGPFAMVAH